jgi:ribosomal protein S18 acetylase RimI-like enzyme
MSQTNLQFRPATPADISNITSLVRSAYRGEESRKGWTTEADFVADDRIDEAGVLAKIANPNGVLLLGIDDSGALVACCELLKLDSGIGYFGLFAVSPQRQGAGLGKHVLKTAESYAQEIMGAKSLEMTVIAVRAELIAWYMRRGYNRTGEKRPFPYEQLVNGKALRDDLYFDVLTKDLTTEARVAVVV